MPYKMKLIRVFSCVVLTRLLKDGEYFLLLVFSIALNVLQSETMLIMLSPQVVSITLCPFTVPERDDRQCNFKET